ncbi:MAG: ATP-binding protein [Cyclobacteriaceae bacterium]|jgi:signal transduction histidine kinase|nr:ATP-binding protein [Cyclobacteriaceae bacterium]
MLQFTDLSIVLAATYLAQALIGITLFIIYRHFGKIYDRKFLFRWAYAWVCFAVAMMAFIFLTGGVARMPAWYPIPLFVSWVSIAFSYAHIFLMMAGVYELLRARTVSKKWVWRGLALAGIISLAIVFAFAFEPTYSAERYILRVGLRYLVACVCFLAAGSLLFSKHRVGIGLKLMSGLMFLYGLVHAYYLTVVLSFVFQKPLPFPSFFGIIDLVLMAGIGLALIIWLLEDERERLNKTNRELDSFLYSTSHDLRAPIASILGLTNLARLEMTDPKGLELVAMIEQRVKKLDEVIGDILRLSRSKQSNVQWTRVSLDHLIDEVVADVKFAKNAPDIRLIYERSPDHVFVADFALMKTVFGNLFSNAVKYHRIPQEDPYIKVTYQENPGAVMLTVEDNGQGIREENLDRIFDMFYRASTTSDGTGLGLYIVKEALNKMHATVAVRSQADTGTTFTITVPQPN